MLALMKAHRCPRRRHFERLYDILGALPPPGGPAAAELPTLESRRDALAAGPVVDWAAMPAACDPCRGGSLGSNTHGGAERTASGNGLEDPREVLQDDGPGTPLRGRNKRWQVRRALPSSVATPGLAAACLHRAQSLQAVSLLSSRTELPSVADTYAPTSRLTRA